MSSFTGNLYSVDLGLTDEFEVTEPISFYSTMADKGLKTTLLPGFKSDGDSITWYLKPIVRGSARRFQRAYAFHDCWARVFKFYYLLNPKLKLLPEHSECPHSYKMGNLLLDEALKVLEMNAYTRAKIYYGLQIGCNASDDLRKLENACAFSTFEIVEIIDGKEKTS